MARASASPPRRNRTSAARCPTPSLEPGKLADMVVLSDDPLTVDPMKIADIRVLQTIKEGVTVYKYAGK